MSGIIQVQRSPSLEFASLGLIAAGLQLPAGGQDRPRIVELIQNHFWPDVLTDYFRLATPVLRPYGPDFALASCLSQAALFTQQPYESIDLEAYWQAAESANLNRDWVNPRTRAWLADLPGMLAILNGLAETKPIQAAFAFAFQTGQIRFLQTAASAGTLIEHFSRGKYAVQSLTLLPNPLQIPGLTFISKGKDLYLALDEASNETILRAYLHAALQTQRMQLLELSWRSGPGAVIDLSALALKGQAREVSLEGTLHLMEEALVACLAALILPGTIKEKKQRLADLELAGYTAARTFEGMASFPIFEDEIPLYIRQLQRGV